ncbi:MAG: hypothetical protein M3137_11420 [Actinomycetota bacterium]|nr:hypothetical protein [Actinomycetota bacterium]
MELTRKTAAAAIAASILAGGAAGIALFGPGLAGAQTTTTPPATGSAPDDSHVGSHEDPAHEAAESPEREAEEDAGRGFRGHGGGSNEDPAHEASESPEREAAEDAHQAPSAATPPTTTPPTTAPAVQNQSF